MRGRLGVQRVTAHSPLRLGARVHVRRADRVPPPLLLSSNAAVSVLLGQRWRDMQTAEKASYVAAARKIKDDFVRDHPDHRRSVTRKKRKLERPDGGAGKLARNVAPPSLHALALVGSRLNQQPYADAASYPDGPPLHSPPAQCPQPSLLDTLCTVAENEHTAAAQMLSSLGSF
jgi:hypothetical protein